MKITIVIMMTMMMLTIYFQNWNIKFDVGPASKENVQKKFSEEVNSWWEPSTNTENIPTNIKVIFLV